MDTTLTIITALAASATGAAIVKLIDNIIQWKLNRRAKVEDEETEEQRAAREAEAKRKSEIETKLDAIADCVAILSIDRLQNCCKVAIHEEAISLMDRQRIHAMYTKAHVIGVNGDLKDLLELVDKLPLKDPLADNNDHVFEEGET